VTITRLKKIVFFSIRLIWALVVLSAVCLAWVVLFLVFLPFIIIATLLGAGTRATEQTQSLSLDETSDSSQPLIFDRRRDISKLFGCNTRNVQYRWDLFAAKLEQIRAKSETPQALDFGAGSLRDSYELARLDFCVTSVDLDPGVMERYYRSYDWTKVRCPPRLFTEPLEKLNHSGFHLAIAFDVIEHLEDPLRYCRSIHSLLNESGLLFAIVPNRRSVFERYFKYSIRKLQAKGIPYAPGVPHLQFKLPSEWDDLFEQTGFKVIEHDMAIGFFVNDCWAGLLGVPLRVFVTPVLGRVAEIMRLNFDQFRFEERFSPPWLMKRVDLLDQSCKKWLAARFGWNLIVAAK
jgi:2-polyprenyl-3-methyl-5-hydroxy-6-metoxy-1,4-benzoquinol methylase